MLEGVKVIVFSGGIEDACWYLVMNWPLLRRPMEKAVSSLVRMTNSFRPRVSVSDNLYQPPLPSSAFLVSSSLSLSPVLVLQILSSSLPHLPPPCVSIPHALPWTPSFGRAASTAHHSSATLSAVLPPLVVS